MTKGFVPAQHLKYPAQLSIVHQLEIRQWILGMTFTVMELYVPVTPGSLSSNCQKPWTEKKIRH